MKGLFPRKSRSQQEPPVWQPPAAGVAMAHQILREQMARRRGGAIGIGNKAAIALRFDHGLNNFKDLVVPLLRRYNLPSSQAYPTQLFTGTNPAPEESDAASWDDIRHWALTAGVEPIAHSRTHRPPETVEALRDEIIGARAELAAAVPESAIETWAIPGGGGSRYMGFDAGKAPDRFYDTTAGAMILSTYGFATGHLPGAEWQLQGHAPIGSAHSTVDKVDALKSAWSKLRQVIDHRTGYVVMLHPRYLTFGNDFVSIDLLDEFLAFVAQQRKAGHLEVMTVGGLAHASAGSHRRLNLVDGGSFPEDWEQLYLDTDRWVRVAETSRARARTFVRTKEPGTLLQAISGWRAAPHRGAVLEIIAYVRSSKGAVMRIGSSSIPGAVRDEEVPAGSRWRAVRQYVTIPLNSKGPITVGVGSSGGDLEVMNFRVQPI